MWRFSIIRNDAKIMVYKKRLIDRHTWCGQQDLNLHLLNENKNLNLARLPIPPCPHYVAILDYTSIYVNSMCPKWNIILRDTKIDLHKRLILAKILI